MKYSLPTLQAMSHVANCLGHINNIRPLHFVPPTTSSSKNNFQRCLVIVSLFRGSKMGQALMKLVPGSQPMKDKEIVSILEECYDQFLAKTADKSDVADFYQAVCQTVEEINKKLNSTQFRFPDKEKLKEVYESHYHAQQGSISKEEFQKILQELIMHSGFTGFGSKDTLLFIFGVPAAALFLKQRIAPKAVPNDVFIPSVTSATVYLLAKLNKI